MFSPAAALLYLPAAPQAHVRVCWCITLVIRVAHEPLLTCRSGACRKPVAEFIGELRALKPKDITAVVGKMLKSPISVASIGDITDIPRYDSLSKRFG